VIAALDEVLGSIGAWYSFDLNGVLRMGRLEAPSGTPDLTLVDNDDLVGYTSIERVVPSDATKGLPSYKVNLQYEKNYTIGTNLLGNIGGFKWGIHDIGATADWFGLAYGNGMFVMTVRDSNDIYTSPDGLNWTPRTMPATLYWHNVVYGGGKFVAVAAGSGGGNTNIAAYSTDGITWTQCTLPSSRSWWYIVYGGGKFIAWANANSAPVAVSTNGIDWTEYSVPTADGLFSGAYGNGMFVIKTGGSGEIVTSTNGTDWTARMPGALAGISSASMAYGNGVFVAIEKLDSTSNEGAISTDGITWRDATLPLMGYWYVIRYCGTLFIVTSADGSVTLLSPDGILWNIAWIPTQSSYTWHDVVFGNGMIIAIQNASNVSAIFDTIARNPDRLWFSKEFRTVTDSDAAVLTAHLLSPETNVTTLLIDETAAQAECTRLLNLNKVRRDTFQVVAPSSEVAWVQPGKIVKLYSSRWGLSAGKLFIVIGITIDWELGMTTLIIWG